MPRPWRIRFAGAKYHVTQRGNGRDVVFYCDAERERFLLQLDECLKKDNVKLYAYALMPNHFHLLVETPWGNLGRFMQRLTTSYAMYFRYRRHRPGHCFQGRYGAKLVGGDEYILRLMRYIHLNPVKTEKWAAESPASRLAELTKYPWSSYRGYAGLREPEKRIDYKWLKLAKGVTDSRRRAAYRRYVERMACEDDREFLTYAQESRYAIGDRRFIAGVEGQLKELRTERRETGDIVWPEDELPGIEQVEAAVVDELGVSREDLHFHGHRAGLKKALAIEACCRLSGESQRAVSAHFGYRHESAIGKQRRLAVEAMEPGELNKIMNNVAKKVQSRF